MDEFLEDIAKGRRYMMKGPQDRAQGHTSSDGGQMRSECLELNELSATREIRFKPKRV